MKAVRVVLPVLVLLTIALVAGAQSRRYPLPPKSGGITHSPQSFSAQTQNQPEALPAKYTFLELDPLGTGEGYCYADAHAINDLDQVVVDWSDPADCNILHASLWDNGKWTLLDYSIDPNCSEPATYLTSITDLGFAFGTYWSACPYSPAGGVFVRTHNWYFLPDIKGFPYNQGTSMNNFGQAVGSASVWDSESNQWSYKHWLWDGKHYSYPMFPPSWDVNDTWAGPLFINDFGRVAGQFWDLSAAGRRRGYVQDGRKLTIIDAPNNPIRTGVNGINDIGEVLVIGRYADGDTSYPASFLWTQGAFTRLPDVPFQGSVETYVYGLNNRGDLSGIWVDNDDLTHAFVAVRHYK